MVHPNHCPNRPGMHGKIQLNHCLNKLGVHRMVQLNSKLPTHWRHHKGTSLLNIIRGSECMGKGEAGSDPNTLQVTKGTLLVPILGTFLLVPGRVPDIYVPTLDLELTKRKHLVVATLCEAIYDSI